MYESEVGRFSFSIEHRDLGSDCGPCIHVYGPTPHSSHEEILRFDCFAKDPHYHIAWSFVRTHLYASML